MEEALVQEQNAAKSAMAALEERLARLKAEIRELREKQARAFQQLEERAERERQKYDAARSRWRTS
ncbi:MULTISPECIES: hypothetical protein [Sphingobium]|uniref:Transposase n=1 Tax=Sphingobium tyrosinilyticum TaxID=2715436 RepID=A0ABV9F1V3_9SPHN|nr:hypothetical protein [Sphingobium sp. EP60837]